MEKEPHSHWMPKGLVTAFRTLTILPVPGEETEHPAASLPWFPITGAALGVFIWLTVSILQQWIAWPAGLAIAALVAGIILTRGLHLDGLADWADAFWGGWTREHILAIMKDSALGTFGATALVVVLLAKWCSIAALVGNASMRWIPLAMIISRALQVDLAFRHDYARPEGGTGERFISDATKQQWTPAAWSTAVLVILFGGFMLRPVIALLLAWGLAWAFGHWCRKKTSGMTGDLLGAASELTETFILLFGAALG